MIESAFGAGDVEPAVLPRHHLEAAEWRSVGWKGSEIARIRAFESRANIGGGLFGSKVKFVAGFVVARQEQVWTRENLPLAMRAGIEAPGIIAERREEDDRR